MPRTFLRTNAFLKPTHFETRGAVTRSVPAVVLSFSFLSYSSILA